MSNTRNVEAFEKLVGIFTGSGGQFTAGSPNLRTENLLTTLARSQNVLRYVSDAKTSFENATHQREVVAKEVSQLASRVLAELKSSGAMPQRIDDARSMVRKIKGAKASGKAPESAPAGQPNQSAELPPTSHSHINGKDYTGLGFHFEKLIQTISSEPLYQPVEPELQVVGLQNTLTHLRTSNTAVASANGVLMKARRDRNAVLYTNPDSMYNIALAAKQRAKAAFGYHSEVARDAGHIRLTKPQM